MTPMQQTLYTITLFLALNALRLWTKRRNRPARRYRASLALYLHSAIASRA